ncbi:MAG: flippase activity-associated protein Agl23 [Limisphaerales bacterium]
MKARAILAFIFVVAVAQVLRVGDLALRPLHSDEAINAVKLDRLWTTGEYRYDPHEYHGPVLYYLALPVARVVSWLREGPGAGPDETGMRMVAVLAGVGLILVSILWLDGLGWRGWWISGLWVAVSPAFVYYSRYFIHEMVFVFFTALTLGAGWRYACRSGAGWAALFGAGVGMMYATKETFVFALLAMGIAAAAVLVWEGGQDRGRGANGELAAGGWRRVRDWLRWVPWTHWIAAVGAMLVVWALFFTSFLSLPRGALDSVLTYWIWLQRAGGASPHIHSWSFYWERLGWFHERGGPVWTEGALLGLAVLGGIMATGASRMGNAERRLARFLLIYTVILAGIYTVLPYKTPWCLLGFHHGVALLAGIAVRGLLGARPVGVLPVAVWALVLAAAGHLGWQAWRASREYAADFRNPYVYAHTSADITNLLDQVREVSDADPSGRDVRVDVVAPGSNYWPLPWYLRDFERVGWWDRVPEASDAPIQVIAARLKAGLQEKSNDAWLMVGMFELQPRYFFELYVEAKLWERFLSARRAAREFEELEGFGGGRE